MTLTQLFTPMSRGGGLPEEAWVEYYPEQRQAYIRTKTVSGMVAYFQLDEPQGRFAFGCYVAGVCETFRRYYEDLYGNSGLYWHVEQSYFWNSLQNRWQAYARGEVTA